MSRIGKKIRAIAASSFAMALMTAPAARATEMGPYNVGFNLNFPQPAGDSAAVIKDGFGFGLDVGYRPEGSPLGLRLDVSHGSFDLTQNAINKIDHADSGWASFWAFDMSAVLTTPNSERMRPYLQFGPGIYHEQAEASRNTAGGGFVCDPYFGCWDYSNTEGVADFSTWRLGWMGGAGLNIEFDHGGALFLQAQYHVINNTKKDLEFVPLAIGFRQWFLARGLVRWSYEFNTAERVGPPRAVERGGSGRVRADGVRQSVRHGSGTW
jgi:opacity protein-like surface antigen